MENINPINNKKINKAGVILGIIYGLVAAGFYTTPTMIFLLGMASLSTNLALQNILIKEFSWLFLLLGVLLTLITVVIYLRKKNIEKITLAEIKPYRAFIGGIIIALITTYAIVTTLALFSLAK